MNDRARLALLRALISRQTKGGSTQRQVATALGVSKVEARRRLRAAVGEGLVEEEVRAAPGAQGQRLFWVSLPAGLEELKRLEQEAQAGRRGPNAPWVVRAKPNAER